MALSTEEEAQLAKFLGLWKKGSVTLVVCRINDQKIQFINSMGDDFSVGIQTAFKCFERLPNDGWVKVDLEDTPSIVDLEEKTVKLLQPSQVLEPPKIRLVNDTVLRRKDGQLFLMTRQENGWEAVSFPVASEAYVLEKFNVRLGSWAQDEYGDYCPVTCVSHKVVTKPPRPDLRKSSSSLQSPTSKDT